MFVYVCVLSINTNTDSHTFFSAGTTRKDGSEGPTEARARGRRGGQRRKRAGAAAAAAAAASSDAQLLQAMNMDNAATDSLATSMALAALDDANEIDD
jgi:hypothetical protein